MKTEDVKKILQRYFEGISTEEEEITLRSYFHSAFVDEEMIEYKDYFLGMSELSENTDDDDYENQLMKYIIKSEGGNSGLGYLYITLTGIAASLIIILGGLLFYQQHRPDVLSDTFDNPRAAYAYAKKTLVYVSSKYNQGLTSLSSIDKLQTAADPYNQEVRSINELFEKIENEKQTINN